MFFCAESATYSTFTESEVLYTCATHLSTNSHVSLMISPRTHAHTHAHVQPSVPQSREEQLAQQSYYGVHYTDEYDYLQHLKEPGTSVLEPVPTATSPHGATVSEISPLKSVFPPGI